ncbi:hypothetical protein [Kitasatospora sp. NPDC001175]|uniref:hypothetical protein n=1 Tax=Kitasatospora sp. NPDC001175 TaxID=3157103 RepID=UPI003D069C4A
MPLAAAETTDRSRSAESRTERRRTARPAARWSTVLTLYLTEVAFRLFLIRHRVVPRVHPDEDAYLVLARALAGGRATASPAGVVVPGGYSLLVAPALALAHDPATAYRLVLAVNALVAASVLPLGLLALRRTGVADLPALAVAGTASLLPPAVFYSQFALTDAILPALLLGWLLCLHSLLRDGPLRRRTAGGAGLGLLAGYAISVHDRGVVLAVVTAGVLLLALVRGWTPRAATLLAGAALGASATAAVLLARYLQDRFSDAPPSSVGSQALTGMLNTALLDRTCGRVLGQLWYLTVSTWGIGGIGFTACAALLMQRHIPLAERVVAAVILITPVLVAGGAATALPEDHRLDDNVYARYLSLFAPALFLVGSAALHRLPRPSLLRHTAATVGLVGLCGSGVLVLAGHRLRTEQFLLWALPDSSFLAGDWHAFHLLRSTAAALAVLALSVGPVAAPGRRAVPYVTAALAVWAVTATCVITVRVSQPGLEPRWPVTGFPRAAGLRPDDLVALSSSLPRAVQCAQAFQIDRGRVWYVDFARQSAPSEANVAVLPTPRHGPPTASWPRAPRGWSVVRSDPANRLVVWRRDASRSPQASPAIRAMPAIPPAPGTTARPAGTAGAPGPPGLVLIRSDPVAPPSSIPPPFSELPFRTRAITRVVGEGRRPGTH